MISRRNKLFIGFSLVWLSALYTSVSAESCRKRPLALVPYRLLSGGLAPARSLAHVGVADVEVSDYLVARFQAQQLAHEFVVGDESGAPHNPEAEGMGGE